MTRERRLRGIALVGGMNGSAEAKSRLGMILETLAGKCTVAQAAVHLGIGERRFHDLRNHCLRAALTSLEPRPAGRPARPPFVPEPQRVAALERAVRNLKIDLRAAQLREEIALAMPHLLQRNNRVKKATRRKSPR